MTTFRKKGDRDKYDFLDRDCIGRPCWAPGHYQDPWSHLQREPEHGQLLALLYEPRLSRVPERGRSAHRSGEGERAPRGRLETGVMGYQPTKPMVHARPLPKTGPPTTRGLCTDRPLAVAITDEVLKSVARPFPGTRHLAEPHTPECKCGVCHQRREAYQLVTLLLSAHSPQRNPFGAVTFGARCGECGQMYIDDGRHVHEDCPRANPPTFRCERCGKPEVHEGHKCPEWLDAYVDEFGTLPPWDVPQRPPAPLGLGARLVLWSLRVLAIAAAITYLVNAWG